MKRVAVVCLSLSIALGGSAGFSQEAEQAVGLIAEADATFDRWNGPFDFDAYRARLETSIALWEEALPLIPDQDLAVRAHTLTRLAQAYFELGEAYLTDPVEKERVGVGSKNSAHNLHDGKNECVVVGNRKTVFKTDHAERHHQADSRKSR